MEIIKTHKSWIRNGRRRTGWTKFNKRTVYEAWTFEDGKTEIGTIVNDAGWKVPFTGELYFTNKRKLDKFVASVEAGNPDMTLCCLSVEALHDAVTAEDEAKAQKKADKEAAEELIECEKCESKFYECDMTTTDDNMKVCRDCQDEE